MSRTVILRLFDTFFRRWWLFLLPMIVLSAVGVSSALSITDTYRSAGSINVASDTLLSSLTSIGQTEYGWSTPAAVTSNKINELMRTGEFVRTVAVEAGLETALGSGAITLDQIRAAVFASANGDNLVSVGASSNDPELAFRLASATVTSFRQWVIDMESADSQVAIDVLTTRLEENQTTLTDAQSALNRFVAENPPSLTGQYPIDQQLEVDRLTAAVQAAQTRLEGTQTSLDEANLTREQTTTNVNQRLQVIDEPEFPYSRQPKVKKMVLTAASMMVAGFILTAGAVVLATALDRAIRFPDDVDRLGLPVLATVPKVGR